MGVSTKTVHNHLVYYDTDEPQRWIDVIGPNVVKHIFDGVNYSADLYTATAVSAGAGTSAITAVASTDRGELVFTSAANEDDGIQIQLLGEAFILNGSKYPCYFGAKFKLGDVTQSDAFVGLSLTDTTFLAAADTAIGFRNDDAAATLYFLLEKDTAETVTSLTTMVDDTYVTVEFYYDGDTVDYYVDGVLIGSVATSVTNMPDDEHMTFTLAFLTGEAVANTMTVQWARAFQIYE